MRLLVTGGMGFIGSNFIRYMLGKYSDIEIINIDKLSYGANPANLKDMEDDRRYRFIKGDICDFELIKSLAEDVDVIVNIAAETHVDRSISNPRAFLESNTIGAFNLLEVSRTRNLTFLQVSTDEIYGSAPEGSSFNEEDTLNPSSPYSASKASGDMFVRAYYKTYGLRAFITRSTNNFGPFQFPEKLIPKTILRALLDLKVPIYGSGKQVRDWIYVLDHCEALDLVLRRGSSGEIYNISGSNELENIQVVEMILDIISKPKSSIEHVDDRPGHDYRYSLDSTRIRKELGWRPRHLFKDALEETVRWYINNKWWWHPLTDEKILNPTPWKLHW